MSTPNSLMGMQGASALQQPTLSATTPAGVRLSCQAKGAGVAEWGDAMPLLLLCVEPSEYLQHAT
eukprot:4170535-Pyramimonas_sp.AAC.1